MSVNALAVEQLRQELHRLQTTALVVGSAGLALSLGAWLLWPAHFYPAYLVAFLFWLGISLGCIGLTMLHHLTGGSWGLVVRRPLEAGAVTVALMALAFLPLALGIKSLYPWAAGAAVGHEHALERHPYLSETFFFIRVVIYFAAWIAMAVVWTGQSARQDATADHGPSRLLQSLSGPGAVILFVTGTFSAIDWGMSLEPRWPSTIYGALIIVGDALSTLAFVIAVASWLARARPMAEIATPGRLNDLGNLMLAFVMLWAYMSFCQFLIIWSGNLAEEIPWYLRRTRGAWQWVALALVIFQFFFPFFVLLFRANKTRPGSILPVALWVLVMRWIEVVWLILPAKTDPASPRIPWIELPIALVATAGLGGIWAAVFLGRLERLPLVPQNDPSLNAALEHA